MVITASTPSGRTRDWLAFAILASLFVAAWAVVAPWSSTPLIDDWVYAWSVEHLLATGSLSVLPFSAVYPIAQILWAAPFAGVLGVSFVALRVSTTVLAVLGCWAVYLTLREIDCRRSTSLLGGVALALHPVYFALTFSFMTEVPFVSLSTWALHCYVRAVRRDQPRLLWAGGAFAIAAYAVRPIGILLPLTVLPALAWRAGWRHIVRSSVPALAAPIAVMLVLQVGLPRVFGPLDWAEIRGGYLQWWFTVPMASYAGWTIEALVQASFPFAPLLLVFAFSHRRRAPAVATVAALLAVMCWLTTSAIPDALSEDQTWSLREFTARSMIDGTLPTPAWTRSVRPFVNTLGLLTLGALVVVAIQGWVRRSNWGRPQAVIVTYGVLYLGAIDVLWLYNDRYYVALAPALVLAAARALDASRTARWAAAASMVVLAGIDVTGTRDMLAFNQACHEAARDLEASGIPAWEIDAGYPLNGWRLYAHPENLPAGADRRYYVPYVTSKATTRFALTNTPGPGDEVMRAIPLGEATWQATREFYVVRRPPSRPAAR